ncbi:hypothetical protein KCMC57_up10890 [Kitasatospora sp. CMC57]|uniref:Uncharacterized protein n=1 Tax=Kitasatospora sp. CMC57 TaxID=3231513 RepID=A0AB33JPB9_9ACTN
MRPTGNTPIRVTGGGRSVLGWPAPGAEAESRPDRRAKRGHRVRGPDRARDEGLTCRKPGPSRTVRPTPCCLPSAPGLPAPASTACRVRRPGRRRGTGSCRRWVASTAQAEDVLPRSATERGRLCRDDPLPALGEVVRFTGKVAERLRRAVGLSRPAR